MRFSKTPKPYAYLALFAGVFILGFSAIFVRLAGAPGSVTAFYRVFIASTLVLLPFLVQTRKRETSFPKHGVGLAILGGLFFSLDLFFWTTGTVLSGAANPTLMANTAPLWVGLGSIIFLKEYPNNRFWIGTFLAIVGSAVILSLDVSHSFQAGTGTFMGLLAAVFYGGYFLIIQRGRGYMSTLPYYWLTTASSTIFLLIINLTLGDALTGYNLFTILNFIALGVLVQIVGWLMIFYAQGTIPASIVSPTMLFQPVITAIVAVPLLGESLSVQQIAGAIIVLTGVYIVHSARWNKDLMPVDR